MKLYLVRYGDHTKSNARINYRISLTEQGKTDVKHLANILTKSNIENPVIFSSPISYCYATAKIIEDELIKKKNKIHKNILHKSNSLLPENNRFEFYKIFDILKFDSSVIVIGHEPILPTL